MSRTSTKSAEPCATARDAIADFQSAVRLRRAAGNKALDFGVAIFRPQHRADADEREAHVDAEVLQVGFAQIFRVRIVGLGERVEEKLHLLLVDLPRERCAAADRSGARPIAGPGSIGCSLRFS